MERKKVAPVVGGRGLWGEQSGAERSHSRRAYLEKRWAVRGVPYRGVTMKPQRLSSGRPWGAKLFAHRGGRVANPFDCARQLIFGNAKMPGPIFNMVLMLDNDFAAVRSCFTDHLFCAPGYAESKQGRVGFVPLAGWTGQSTVQAWAQGAQAQGDRRLIRQKRNGCFWHLADI
jgi:hypothetical protein